MSSLNRLKTGINGFDNVLSGGFPRMTATDHDTKFVHKSYSSCLGLGLYITRQILELHNATIRVESEIGQGSNFIIELPLAPSLS
jgi:K+-sensing histidine kinase KdpD